MAERMEEPAGVPQLFGGPRTTRRPAIQARRPAIPAGHPLAPPPRPRRSAPVPGHPLAALAGQRILDKGGNAVDAGVAAGICIGILLPDLVSLGGVAPIIY